MWCQQRAHAQLAEGTVREILPMISVFAYITMYACTYTCIYRKLNKGKKQEANVERQDVSLRDCVTGLDVV